MNGYQLTFFTQQDRTYHGKPLGHWLLEFAREKGVAGATLYGGAEGFGVNGRVHSAHFFELADQPMEVVMAVEESKAAELLGALEQEEVEVFYVKVPVEFGRVGARAAKSADGG